MVSFIRSSSDYRRLAQSKNRLTVNKWMSAKFTIHDSALRIGWSLPRQVGNAVTRNRLKRWLREYIRKNRNELGDLRAELSIYLKSHKDFQLKDLEHGNFDVELNKLFKKLRSQLNELNDSSCS